VAQNSCGQGNFGFRDVASKKSRLRLFDLRISPTEELGIEHRGEFFVRLRERLPICRSIIEAHGERFLRVAVCPHGAILYQLRWAIAVELDLPSMRLRLA
jgi:hypothetical protein